MNKNNTEKQSSLRDELGSIFTNTGISYCIAHASASGHEEREAVDAIEHLILSRIPKKIPGPGFHPEFNQEKIGFNNAIDDVLTALGLNEQKDHMEGGNRG